MEKNLAYQFMVTQVCLMIVIICVIVSTVVGTYADRRLDARLDTLEQACGIEQVER